MNVTLNTDAEKALAGACAKTIAHYSASLPPMALCLDTLAELLQRLANGEKCDLHRAHEIFLSTRQPLAPLDDAAGMTMAMAAAAALFQKIIPGAKP